jgi:seryl-tRNA synthetase
VELDNTLSESNKLSKDIGELMKSGEKAKAAILKEKTVALKEKSKEAPGPNTTSPTGAVTEYDFVLP